jgi:hypothetical protein
MPLQDITVPIVTEVSSPNVGVAGCLACLRLRQHYASGPQLLVEPAQAAGVSYCYYCNKPFARLISPSNIRHRAMTLEGAMQEWPQGDSFLHTRQIMAYVLAQPVGHVPYLDMLAKELNLRHPLPFRQPRLRRT